MVIMASSIRYAELHVHLEGALDQSTLLEIAPELDREEVARRYRFNDFAGFLNSFKYAAMQMREPWQYRLLARRMFARMADEGIVYAEVIHSVGICLWRGLDARAIVEALIEEGQHAPLTVRWILDAVRQLGPEHAMQVARFAVDFGSDHIVAFGIGGDELGSSADALRPAFLLAAQHGLKLVPHAGETSTAQNVWEALSLGAHRIGHGIRSIDDPALVAELARRRIPLEISITSNVLTGAVPSVSLHPVKRLFDAGVPILLNTDDPAFFRTTLAQEFALAQSQLGFTPQDLDLVRRNAFTYAFGPASET